MSKLTDRELIGMCDLMNIGIEFADAALKRDVYGKITENHTIYSLLLEEYKGILLREAAMDRAKARDSADKGKKEEVALTIRDSDKVAAMTEPEKQKEIERSFAAHLKQLYIQELGEGIYKEKLGSFYKIADNGERDYIYGSYKKEILPKAPVVMEDFDRYRESKDSRYKYLGEWTIEGVYDHYSACIERIYLTQKKLNKSKGKSKEEIIKTFPTRAQVDNKTQTIYQMKTFINIIRNPIVSGIANALVVGPIGFSCDAINTASKYSITLTLGIFNINDRRFLDNFSEYNLLGEIKTGKVTNVVPQSLHGTVPFKQTINLIDNGFCFSIFKNNNKDVVIAVRGDDNLLKSLNSALNKREYPKELFLYNEIFEDLKETYGADKITITGCDSGAKLAEMIGTYYNFKIHVFYDGVHSNMGVFTNFCAPSIANKETSLTFYTNWELDMDFINGSSEAAVTLFVSLLLLGATAPIGGAIVMFIGTLLNVFYNNMKKRREKLKVEKLFAYLKEYKIISEDKTIESGDDKVFNKIEYLKSDKRFTYELNNSKDYENFNHLLRGQIDKIDKKLQLKRSALIEMLYREKVCNMFPITYGERNSESYFINLIKRGSIETKPSKRVWTVRIVMLIIEKGLVKNSIDFNIDIVYDQISYETTEKKDDLDIGKALNYLSMQKNLGKYIDTKINEITLPSKEIVAVRIVENADKTGEVIEYLLEKAYTYQQNYFNKKNYVRKSVQGSALLESKKIDDIKFSKYTINKHKKIEKKIDGIIDNKGIAKNNVNENMLAVIMANELRAKKSKESFLINEEYKLV